jgi:hypothetical protein
MASQSASKIVVSHEYGTMERLVGLSIKQITYFDNPDRSRTEQILLHSSSVAKVMRVE